MTTPTLDIYSYLDQDEKKDLLRLLTAGSVDDGKSTLIGRLLFDSKKITKISFRHSNATANGLDMPVKKSIMPCCSTV